MAVQCLRGTRSLQTCARFGPSGRGSTQPRGSTRCSTNPHPDLGTHRVRTVDSPVELVWRAHTEPELVKQWATGPPDHSLPVCEIDLRVGGKGRYVWKNRQLEMGMTAEFKEIVEHERIVHTERFDGWPTERTGLSSDPAPRFSLP